MRNIVLSTILLMSSAWHALAVENSAADATIDAHPNAAVLELIERVDKNTNRSPKDELIELRRAVAELLQLTPENVLVQAELSEANKQSNDPDSGEAAKNLRQGFERARRILTFKPIQEASPPRGFPDWTPVGEIQLREYPAYRLARTKIRNDKSEDSAFWTLFGHIQTNKIEMTAPVEMTYASTVSQAEPQGVAMAFLYESQEIGALSARGDVEVVDAPAQTVLSIGLAGDINDRSVASAQEHLQSWLDDSKQFVACGDLRVLGYNSPMVPVDRRYFEVQIPVCKE